MAAASGEDDSEFRAETGFSRGWKRLRRACATRPPESHLKVNGSAEQLKALLCRHAGSCRPAPPSSQCLSPIGEELIPVEALTRSSRWTLSLHAPCRFSRATRSWSKPLSVTGKTSLGRKRDARVPLIVPAGCLRDYGLHLARELEGCTTSRSTACPILILVHVASTNPSVPDAIAYPGDRKGDCYLAAI